MNSPPHISPPSQTQRIMVIDDDPAQIAILVKLLKEKGYRVRAFRDACRALESLEIESVDLILLDIRMPGMSGFQVCGKLKENRLTLGIPVIFLTAADETGDKIKGLELGAVDYITKPYNLDEVIARVERQLKLKSEYRKSKGRGLYRKSGLDSAKHREICQRLITCFEEERLYLLHDLDAEAVARKIKVSRHNLSEAMNVEMQQNMSTFINRQRIDYFCELLGKHPDASILELALASGYNSKSVFNHWFKTIKKMTPRAYIKTHRRDC